MKEKGVIGNFNKRKGMIEIVEKRMLVNKDRMDVAKEFDVERISSNLAVIGWWHQNKHKSSDDSTLMHQGSEA